MTETTTQEAPSVESPDSDVKKLKADEARAEVIRLRARLAEVEATLPVDTVQEPAQEASELEKAPEVAEVYDQLHALWGAYTCPECGVEVIRLYPGYTDPDAGERAMVCSNGHGFFPTAAMKVKAAAPAEE